MAAALERFSAPTREWFEGAFRAPTRVQLDAWTAIAGGGHALVVAPTGSGKTLSAFLWAIDRLIAAPTDADATTARTRVLYLSPLKALGIDVERNLRAPLTGVTNTAARLGRPVRPLRVGVRSGDTPASERRALLQDPPDILITTPESLYLMLTSSARETLRGIETVIVDEVHAVAGTKRGSHLALSLERLDALLEHPAQRIGLSATVRPADEVARFLGGIAPVTVVAPPTEKTWNLRTIVPVEDMSAIPSEPRTDLSTAGSFDGDPPGSPAASGSIWPFIEESIVDRILEHRSTIVFANSRRLAEKLTARINEIAELRTEGAVGVHPVGADAVASGETPARVPGAIMGQAGQSSGAAPVLAKSHHGSVSKEQRAIVEDELKTGRLRCVVATSSLELGIDMGAVDLVIQVESPPSVGSGLQRVGRAGHNVGDVSRGTFFPKHRADLVNTAVVTERMAAGLIEELRVPSNPLDVLAQQTIAAAAAEPVDVEQWFALVKRSAPYATLPRSAFSAVLDLISGRYPSDEFAELRPRVIWDRDAGTLTARPGALRLAVTSGGTIPDRGMFGVYLVGERPTRVGELDEEMVYESRVQDVITLGATSWRIEEITRDRVMVSPAFGQPGRLPFWKGDGLGRPAELGRAVGEFMREIAAADPADAELRLTAAGLDANAVANLTTYLREQRDAVGRLPSDRTFVVERFRDELGDWRLVLHSPLGQPVHQPWALAVGERIQQRYGLDGNVVSSDDGIVVRIPDTDADPPGAELFLFDPDELDDLVTAAVGGSALFASRFRENAARALLLPNRTPGRRSPLWQQRQRAGALLEVAHRYPDFPIILETVREVLQEVYDLPALLATMRAVADRSIRVTEVETAVPSPFARTLLFGYVGAFLYEGDSPLAERRAAALSLDAALLGELLGRVELRELLDPAVVAQTEAQLQRLSADRRLHGAEGAADLLRMLGPLTTDEVAARLQPDDANRHDVLDPAADDDSSRRLAVDAATAERLLRQLERQRRVLDIGFAGRRWWAAVEDAGRLRDALGAPVPPGVADAFQQSVADPLGDLVSRFARTHGPFTTGAVAERLGIGVAVATGVLDRLASERRIVAGEFSVSGRGPGPAAAEWCDAEVLRRLRTRSLAALRREVEPVPQPVFGIFLPQWQGVGGFAHPAPHGTDAVLATIEQLAGYPAPASAWESLILPSRVSDYATSMLDELTASGEVVWAASGAIGAADGWLSLHPADTAHLTLPPVAELEFTAQQQRVLQLLERGGGWFFAPLAEQLHAMRLADGREASRTSLDRELTDDLWALAWAGYITNDTLAPLRARLGAGSAHRAASRTPRSRMARPGRSALRSAAFASQGLGSTPVSERAVPSRQGPPAAAGRWSALQRTEVDATVRAHATATMLLDRYGVVTKGSVVAEGVPGGFAGVYRVLTGFEDAGRARRGYFIEGLGGAQFSDSRTVDRLRSVQPDASIDPSRRQPVVVTLAATDPANPYGAALGWPQTEGHRPGRKAGALVTLVDGQLALYLERGGKTLLAFSDDALTLTAACRSLADLIRSGRAGRITIERADGEWAAASPVGRALVDAGFRLTPKGLRLA